jgi:hypothetical protein
MTSSRYEVIHPWNLAQVRLQLDRSVHAVRCNSFAGTKSIRRHSACRPEASVDQRGQGQCSKPEYGQVVRILFDHPIGICEMLKDEMDLLHCICRTLCLAGSLDPAKVKDKIVVCTTGVNGRVEKGQAGGEAGRWHRHGPLQRC